MIRKYIFTFLIILSGWSCSTTVHPTKTGSQTGTSAQQAPTPEPEIYHGAYTRINDLVHTRLEITPDWTKKQVRGTATLTLRRHFYPGDSVVLNARGMDLHTVVLASADGSRKPLPFVYSEDRIHIRLDRTYSKDETFTIYIDYTAKPNELKTGGSAAIQDDKGFYFINADGKNPDKPTEFWTQGETESNSAWFPTIESPEQRMTQEIYITVDTVYETLSNGLLLSTRLNNDGTKTDYWKQSLPAAPYLTMIAAGDYAIVKEKWRAIELSYYVDKPYEKFARMIFGNTPEMMEFFSKKLGVDFAWEKYAQIVVHDYVSGAMENTTAVVHGTNVQQDPGEFMDGNYEDYISHELFHHWFGNLVTCESWANLTLNEGFANYSEYLWKEYKYGRDEADCLNQGDQAAYIHSTSKNDAELIRYGYADREDMYDVISYQKGGRVLHMLRKYVGDDAFFASLKLYLENKRFSSAEVHDLRMAFEKITGEDLNWFFNQWYLKQGKPALTISYNWDEVSLQQHIVLEQTQDFSKNPLYRIPMDVDFYYGGRIERKRIVLDSAKQEFTFALPSKPDLVNVDAEKMLLCTRKDAKDKNAWLFQFYHAPLFLDRYDALVKLATDYRAGTREAQVVLDALHDRSWKIRLTGLDNISELAKNNPDTVSGIILKLAKHDPSSDVREAALKMLGKYFKYDAFTAEFASALNDSSYQVKARAFRIISEKDSTKAFHLAQILEADSGSVIFYALTAFYADHPEENHFPYFIRAIRKSKGWERYQIMNNFGKYLARQEDTLIRKGISFLETYASYTEKKHLLNTINNCYKTILSDLKVRIETKETELEKAEKDKIPFSDRTLLTRKIHDLRALKEEVSNAQDKLHPNAGH
ncbi:MAG TPA: M1 family aminopeptidase [Bacteroidia bacterium]|nr:M1 family aminopeptidase [Bacteroidia bacterium]